MDQSSCDKRVHQRFMGLIDTHCHLNDQHAFPVPEMAIAEALEAGIDRLIVVGIDTKSSRLAVEIAEKFEAVYAVVGWHPNHASDYKPEELVEIREMLSHPKVVALGEIGLDYFRDHATREDQYKCLMDQLDLATETGAKVVFHCREAYPDLLDLLEKRAPQPYLFHCFAGSADDAKRAVKLDSYFGVDGPITYKSSDPLRETLRSVPKDRIVIETDSPWMAPVPYRGQRNRPSWVKFVNDGLAEALEISAEDCAELTSNNAKAFFGELGL